MATLSKEDKDFLLAKYVSALTGRSKCILQPSDHLRYLNASKWDVQKALDVTIAWEKWYFDTPVSADANSVTPRRILDTIKDKHENLYQATCPISHMGEDLAGRPVYWEKTGVISGVFAELIKVLTLDDMVVRHIRNSELTACRLYHASIKHGSVIANQVVVFDLSNLTYTLDTRAITAFSRCTAVDQSFYPERLHACYMINAPWYFTALWSLLRPFVDPVTREKIHILGSDYYSHLQEAIAPEQIPVEYGGKHNGFVWQWPYPEESNCSPSQIEQFNAARDDLEMKFSDAFAPQVADALVEDAVA